jgi:hypothetical protein
MVHSKRHRAAVLTVLYYLWAVFGHANAVSLWISGHSIGSGNLSMNFSGDALNVSILQNGTAWLINATTTTGAA